MKTPLTPLDGRYYEKVEPLVAYLSESALIKYRLYVEIEWLKFIKSTLNQQIDTSLTSRLDQVVVDFDESTAEEIRQIEKSLNHDVKAVEVWLANTLNSWNRSDLVPFIHFGRTSEDINNTAYALMLKDAVSKVLLPEILNIANKLNDMASEYADIPMLSRTHGQPATPTTFGKETAVFAYRINNQIENIKNIKIYAKFSGATGTYSADNIAYPDVNWPIKMQYFIESLGLEYNPLATQIDSHDWIARLNNDFALSGTISIDLCRDFWQYISMGYLKQTVASGEVGSSTMPHKVNPIDFENAESNFGIANALLRHLSDKLPISRLQRDLSDSSALRSLSEAYGHYLLALKSLSRGLSKVYADPEAMLKDLENEWSILTEAVQTIMRKNGITDAYDQMKQLSRGKSIGSQDLSGFINDLDILESDKQTLLNLKPEQYIGLAKKITE